jgi:hypothetical protein
MSGIITGRQPQNHSGYERTYNNAIDLVAQCVGYHRKRNVPLKGIILSYSYFMLFRTGLRILMERAGQEFDPHATLLFDGVEVKQGAKTQFESLVPEYYTATGKQFVN